MDIKKRGIVIITLLFIFLSFNAIGQEISSEESLSSEIDKTDLAIEQALERFGNETSATKKEIIKLMDYNREIDRQKSKLEEYKTDFENVKTSETLTEEQKDNGYDEILLDVEAIQDNLPISMNMIKVIFDNYIDYRDIPDPTKFKSDIRSLESYKIAIYEAQNLISVKGDAKLVSVRYLSGNEDNFRFIKKTIIATGEPELILEVIPYTVLKFVTIGEKVDSKTLKYPGTTTEIIYMIPGDDLLDLENLKTIAIPDLSNVREGTPMAVCGDEVCQYNFEFDIDESSPDNQYYCQDDCKKVERPLWLIILVIIIAVVGVWYINFYKGPGNFKDVVNYISVGLFRRRLFTSKEDLANLSNYIKRSLKKGFKKEQLKGILLKKGWTEDQIEHIFKRKK